MSLTFSTVLRERSSDHPPDPQTHWSMTIPSKNSLPEALQAGLSSAEVLVMYYPNPCGSRDQRLKKALWIPRGKLTASVRAVDVPSVSLVHR